MTETGYASDPADQEDPAFQGADSDSGLLSQAAYVTELVPTLLDAGVAKIFVTERDNLTGEAASEGLIGGGCHVTPTLTPGTSTRCSNHRSRPTSRWRWPRWQT